MMLLLLLLLLLLPAPRIAEKCGSVANEAGSVPVFSHSEDGYNCTRIPTVIVADEGDGGAPVLLAFAEGRKWVGDGCYPHAAAAAAAGRVGAAKAPDQGYTDVVLKRSTSGGRTWSARTVVAAGGWCPSAVWDAKRKTVGKSLRAAAVPPKPCAGCL
jgi:sialidase-1